MVSITLSVPEVIRKKMKQFDDINWSGFVRKCIVKKAEELERKEKLLELFRKEEELIHWSIQVERKAKKGRFKDLEKRSLV